VSKLLARCSRRSFQKQEVEIYHSDSSRFAQSIIVVRHTPAPNDVIIVLNVSNGME